MSEWRTSRNINQVGRIYLSPPDLTGDENAAIARAIAGGWIAPLGPEVDAFEAELAAVTGRGHGVALSSGTAALHLALEGAGVGPGSRVLVQSLTFSASANAVRYLGADPVFVDSEPATWNMDPDLLADALDAARRAGRRYQAVVTVDLYGQCADYNRIVAICDDHGVALVEDAAEALGASYGTRPAGSFGRAAALSFNGNKIITTSGGGALVTDDGAAARRARYLATQAREPVSHYEHTELGYNYRMSNLLAALGRTQLTDLERRVDRRRAHNRAYREALADLPGIDFMPEAPAGRASFWLTALTIDPAITGIDRDAVRIHLEKLDIEARPVWKPMHLQPFYAACEMVGGGVSDRIFANGLCLPSGSSLTDAERDKIALEVRSILGA